MNRSIGGVFNFADRLQIAALDHRLKRGEVISSNIANAETPGYRAIGYDFEDQLQSLAELDKSLSIKTTKPEHFHNAFTRADGRITPEVYMRPTESVGEDGNTVDVDKEMVQLSQNQILYRSAADLISRKIGLMKYAINGGR